MSDTKRIIEEVLFEAASAAQQCASEVNRMKAFRNKDEVIDLKKDGSGKRGFFTTQVSQDKNEEVLKTLQNSVKKVQETSDVNQSVASSTDIKLD